MNIVTHNTYIPVPPIAFSICVPRSFPVKYHCFCGSVWYPECKLMVNSFASRLLRHKCSDEASLRPTSCRAALLLWFSIQNEAPVFYPAIRTIFLSNPPPLTCSRKFSSKTRPVLNSSSSRASQLCPPPRLVIDLSITSNMIFLCRWPLTLNSPPYHHLNYLDYCPHLWRLACWLAPPRFRASPPQKCAHIVMYS